MSKQDELVFLPLGGVGEIGMNLALYGYGSPAHRQWIMVDCGVTFPGLDLPGVDLVLPDIRFLAEERKNLKGIIITHAHEDHYGALADLWPGLNVSMSVRSRSRHSGRALDPRADVAGDHVAGRHRHPYR
jgi:ribonuclease J